MIYVDEIFDYGKRGKWCHLATDSDDLTALHLFAASIGLKRRWFQDHPLHPHYDLTPSKRELAIKCGAQAVTRQELARKCSKLLKGNAP